MWLMVAAILILILVLGSRKPRGYPPGPPRLPLMGYLPFMEKQQPYLQLWRLSAKYGPVVGLYFGMKRTVVVNGWEAVKEALMNEDLNGRPENKYTTVMFGSQLGVLYVKGDFWKEQRRFTLHQLRNLGFAKRLHEAIVQDEALDLIKEIKETEGSITLSESLSVSNISILWVVMGGTRLERKDAGLRDLVNRVNSLFSSGEITGGFVQMLPFLHKFVSKDHPFNVVLTSSIRVTDFVKNAIQVHKATLDPDNPRDFIDTYLVKMAKHENDPNAAFTERQLQVACRDLFNGGAETGSATVSFGVLLMALHPEIMIKVQKELDEVVGRARLPSLKDRSKLVYTDATLAEVLRFRGPAPIAVPHKAVRDTTLQGHRIPANTILLMNTYSVHMDPEYWGDPENFRPERFINQDGSFRKHERHIPFGKGRKSCLGESLAKMTTFLLFSCLMQHFTFTLDPAVPVPNITGKYGFTLSPPNYSVFAKPRL